MAEPMYPNGLANHVVTAADSPEYTHLSWALTHSSIVALDAEWKPICARPDRPPSSSFPTVTLLQLACRFAPHHGGNEEGDSVVFLLDLLAVPLPSVYGLLRNVFTSPDVLKLGFKFKQDLVNLSSTFSSQSCDNGFDRVEPFIDITSIYSLLQGKQPAEMASVETKSLATICSEILGICLSKELQCSDWSQRPLTEEQKLYAAADAHCLLEIFTIFQVKFVDEGGPLGKTTYLHCSAMDESLLKIVKGHGDKILLKDSDKKPKVSRKKGKKSFSAGSIIQGNWLQKFDDWEGPCPWDLSVGGDGRPKFLCDVMVEGLAKQLRCVGIDAATPFSRKPEPRGLLDQARREKRVLLTRDAKLLRHGYLIQNQIYRVKSLLKNEQLLEVIQVLQLNILKDELMSRCTKCNGRFIQKPVTTEVVKASKRFQKIPSCLFDKNRELWQCMDCHQLYWEGTQYHNAVQKFIDICRLSEKTG